MQGSTAQSTCPVCAHCRGQFGGVCGYRGQFLPPEEIPWEDEGHPGVQLPGRSDVLQQQGQGKHDGEEIREGYVGRQQGLIPGR